MEVRPSLQQWLRRTSPFSSLVRKGAHGLLLAVGLLCFASFAQALGLGQIKHENWLGEPLRAEVDIFDPDGQFSPGDIRLRQVRAEEAARMGVDVVAAHLPLKFKVERKDKRLFVRLWSSTPVNEPFMNFMLALEWPGGKSYREYSLLLDPKASGIEPLRPPLTQPTRPAPEPEPSKPQRNSQDGDWLSRNSDQPQRSPRAPAARPATASSAYKPLFQQSLKPQPQQQASNPSFQQADGNAEYHTVRPGQSLSRIAQDIRQDTNIKLRAVTRHLYESNPQAFTGGMETMVVGARLRLPSQAEYARMPRWGAAVVPRQASRPQPPRPKPAKRKQTPWQALQEEDEQWERQQAQSPSDERVAPASDGDAPVVEYQVRSGDTLSQIAQRMRQDPNWPLRDVIAQIYQQNPDAFDGGIHRLRNGANLALRGPAAQPREGYSVSQVAALDEVAREPLGPNEDPAPLEDEPSAKPNPVPSGRLRLSEVEVTEEELLNGKKDLPMARRLQMIAELTDKLDLENRELRRRIKSIETSESLDVLQELLLLQTKQIQSFQQQLSGTIAMLELEQHERGADVGLDRQLQAMTGTIAGTIDRNGDGQAAQAQPGEQGLANTEAQAEPSPPEQAEDETETPAAQEGSQDEQLVAQNQSQTGGSSGAGQGDSSNGEDNENTIEGEGLSSQLADQSAEPDTTQAAANTAPVASEQNSGLWGWLISLGLALLLAIVAMFDWKRSGSILRGRFQKQQTQEDEDLFFTEPLRPKPVVRVRQRDTEGGSDSDEGQVPGPELQIPLADPTSTSGPAQQAEAGESLPDATIPGHGPMEPLVTGIAHWNRKDIPMLDVEEAEVGDLPPDDGRLSFDDFGLMNPISIEDLEIDAGDELGENFELDIDEEEEQRNR